MELARFQSCVARLAVDQQLRERFLDDPAAAAALLGLTAEEAEDLGSQVEGLAPFAESLVRKRLGAVRRLLPRTAARLGARFDAEFRRFAGSRPSKGPRRHERDALEFAKMLQPVVRDEELASLLYESGWIEAGLGRRVVFRRFPKGYAIWLRIGRQVRSWRLGVRPDWTNQAPAAQESE